MFPTLSQILRSSLYPALTADYSIDSTCLVPRLTCFASKATGGQKEIVASTRKQTSQKESSSSKLTDLAKPLSRTLNLVQNFLLLTKLKKRELLRTFKEHKKSLTSRLEPAFPEVPKRDRNNLKPTSTVTGFKKWMYNSVKVSQNQLQPSYNRRKHSHSHYNQTLKENTRLNRIYAHSTKNQVTNYSAFSLNPASLIPKVGLFRSEKLFPAVLHSMQSLKKFSPLYPLLCNSPDNLGWPNLSINAKLGGNGARLELYLGKYTRPIPKFVNFLESRLDTILWRNQFTASLSSARQKLRKGIRVNGGLQKKATFPTFPGDVFFLGLDC
jgi:ribosomal protein S4